MVTTGNSELPLIIQLMEKVSTYGLLLLSMCCILIVRTLRMRNEKKVDDRTTLLDMSGEAITKNKEQIRYETKLLSTSSAEKGTAVNGTWAQ